MMTNTPADAHHGARPRCRGVAVQALLLCIPFASGCAMSVQSAINARLGQKLVEGSPAGAGTVGGFLAATVSFAIGCACCALVALAELAGSSTLRARRSSGVEGAGAAGTVRAAAAEEATGSPMAAIAASSSQKAMLTAGPSDGTGNGSDAPVHAHQGLHLPKDGCTTARPYEYLGGALGAFFVATALLLGPLIGFGLYFVLLICGQLVMSSMLDHTGFLGVAKAPTTRVKVAGLMMSFLGAVMSVVERVQEHDPQGDGPSAALTIVYCFVALCAGLCTGLQAPLNWRLGFRLQSKFRSATVSFFIGWATVGAVALIAAAAATDAVSTDGANAPWYLYIGGALGTSFVVSAIILSVRIGVALFFSAVIAGQLTGSLVVDTTGAFDFAVRDPTALRVLGALTVLAGTCVLNYAKQRAAATAARTATTAESTPPAGDSAL